MVNKTTVRKAVNRWLKEATLERNEDFSVFADTQAGCIMIHIVNPAGEWREDRKETKTVRKGR